MGGPLLGGRVAMSQMGAPFVTFLPGNCGPVYRVRDYSLTLLGALELLRQPISERASDNLGLV